MLDNGCSCIGRTRIFLIGTAIHIPGNINLHFLLIFLGKHAVHLFCVKVQGACQHIVLLAFNGGILTCFLFLCVQLGKTILFLFSRQHISSPSGPSFCTGCSWFTSFGTGGHDSVLIVAVSV